MAVYVDDVDAPFGRMKMSHLMADSTEELLAMVRAIGVNPKWIQAQGTWKEHFDIALSKKVLALQQGAVQITWRQYGEKMIARRKAAQ